jgi:hypothetical protein
MKFSICLLSAAALLAVGCESSKPAAPAAGATDPKPGATNMAAASPAGMTMMSDGVPDKDCSHVITADTPAFTTAPGGQGVAPVGMIKSGTKVLVTVPMGEYSKCMMAGGKAYWVKTSSLKPTTN